MEYLDSQIGELTVVQTCSACPEQYNVYACGKQVAYIRERWEHLTVECPDVGGKLVFETELKNNECVKTYQDKIVNAINKWRKDNV